MALALLKNSTQSIFPLEAANALYKWAVRYPLLQLYLHGPMLSFHAGLTSLSLGWWGGLEPSEICARRQWYLCRHLA